MAWLLDKLIKVNLIRSWLLPLSPWESFLELDTWTKETTKRIRSVSIEFHQGFHAHRAPHQQKEAFCMKLGGERGQTFRGHETSQAGFQNIGNCMKPALRTLIRFIWSSSSERERTIAPLRAPSAGHGDEREVKPGSASHELRHGGSQSICHEGSATVRRW